MVRYFNLFKTRTGKYRMAKVSLAVLIGSVLMLGLVSCTAATGAGSTPTVVFTPPPATSTVSSAPVCETRGVWLNPEAFFGQFCDDPQDADCQPLARGDARVISRINTLLDQLESAHINTLFVASPQVGENCGWANRFVFEDFVSAAQQRGFSLHLWVINKSRPDPACAEDFQADFTDPQEKYRQADWIMELLRQYGQYFDGVHFDYIRYSEWEAVDRNKMGTTQPGTGEEIGVSATVKQVHQMLQQNYPHIKLSAAVLPAEPAYARSQLVRSKIIWQEDVPEWYQDWFAANPGNWYALQADYSSVPLHMKYQQDAIGWLRAGAMDAIIPMNYTLDDAQWNTETEAWKSMSSFQTNNFDKVFMGLRWGKDYNSDPANVIRKIEFGRSIGVKGFVIFELGEWDADADSGQGNFVDDSPLIRLLTVDSEENHFQAPFRDAVASCLAAR
jgi:uncharacterized lipoprotein YddW (UPF0748 family)